MMSMVNDLVRALVALAASCVLPAVAVGSDTARARVGAEIAESSAPYKILATTALETRLGPSDLTALSTFGSGVALGDGLAVVGAPDDDRGVDESSQGSAYVYRKSGGIWQLQQKLGAPDSGVGDRFGVRVALSGESIAVAAPTDNAPLPDQGSVYVFTRVGDVWAFEQKIVAPDGAFQDLFGLALALEGNTLVVGSLIDAGPNLDAAGAVYVFERAGGVWSFRQKLQAPVSRAFDFFGDSVALDGDSMVVAANGDDESSVDAGAVYIFSRSGSTWTLRQKLFRPGPTVSTRFGSPVAIDGETILAGAPMDPVGPTPRQGAVYVFSLNGGTWGFGSRLTASNGASDDAFGSRLALLGNIALVGAPRADVEGVVDEGAAYIFERRGMAWGERQTLGSTAGQINGLFGFDVALSGERALVGAPFEDSVGSPPVSNAGAAYVFNIDLVFSDSFE